MGWVISRWQDKPKCQLIKEPATHSYALTDDTEDEDDEIRPPVLEWLNILSELNYHEISDEHEILPSWSDHRAEAFATESMTHMNEKYEIAVPFQNTATIVPDNFWSAKKRLENQRKTFINDANRANQYIEKMKRLKEMNYIEKVDSTGCAHMSGVWYLPHFTTSQANFCVVYDGDAQYLGTLINNHILLGSDLLNSLVNVLSQFCLGE